MKKISLLVFAGMLTMFGSCKKYLDINENPNSATNSTAELILPQALTGTAGNVNGFNSMGAQLVGYMANAGGYGGFGTAITYNFSASDFSARWSTTYDNLQDYKAILNYTEENPAEGYYNAVARIMKAHGFQLLVDAYGDVPYTEALQGADILTPKYDKAEDIYKDLVSELDIAIGTIHATETAVGVAELGEGDVMFHGDMTKWIQFANTLKLRIVNRAKDKIDFGTVTFDPAGFLTTDAMVNPGYVRDNNRQNPKWSTWGFSNTGSDGNKAWMPSTFALTFYNGTKLSDPVRGAATYYQYPSTGNNRLGNEGNNIVSSPSGSFWLPSSNRNGSTAGSATGVLKGPSASMPIITAAESYFLQAEAVVEGMLTGDAKSLFESGIKASYAYLLMEEDMVAVPAATVNTAFAEYLTENEESYLVNFDEATSNEQKIEAIITQKYIALNMVNADEAWNEYRRTGYPKINSAAGAGATETFASSVSESTRPDKLPARILYPSTEGSYNSTNVPKGINVFTSTIFWAK
ncbi:MAG: SusD/RagB family nutrient-binding outer membrane lipoprotein [Flavitalea sp.]